MNKIVLNSNDELNNLVIEEDTELVIGFSNLSSNLNIIIKDNCLLNMIQFGKNINMNLVITLENSSRLILKRYLYNDDTKIEINLDGEMSNCEIYNSIVSNENSILKLDVRHNNKDTICNICNHGINEFINSLVFDVNLYVSSNGINTISKQENKILNLKNGKSNIYPNLIVDNDYVDVSHSAYISDFDKDSIFYLKSRGIEEKKCRDLLTNSFLFSNADVNCLDEIKKIFSVK